MDENTSMMIQLASMMIQNQNKIRETQSQLEAESEEKPLDASLSRERSSKVGVEQAAFINSHMLGMDPKLMAEFAKQIMMNANCSPQPETFKRIAADKPSTIAQIFQSQSFQKVDQPTAQNSSEGKIFVYNMLPDENMSPANGDIKPDTVVLSAFTNGSSTLQQQFRRGNMIGPIRNRYGRVLRPGIDNFGRFESVANPGLIMHAMELLRQKDKKKRGPKEKETFAVFIYCLPDKNSKLPKFSSLDPTERALVDQHQLEGYGYPTQDYINGIPRKTQLCLTFDDSHFQGYMVSLYPNLKGRFYDLYRIDKTRRLIRVDARSPRQLKDMKYQGSLIVIPYDAPEEKPAPVIHRNFDEVYNGNSGTSYGNPLAFMQNFNIPLTTLFDTVAEPPGMTSIKSEVVPLTNGQVSPCSNSDIKDVVENPFDDVKILQIANAMREKLKPAKRIHIKPETLLTDVLAAYREDSTLEQHKISVSFHVKGYHNESVSQHDDDIDAGFLFVMFWEEAFSRHFDGYQEVFPVIDPSIFDDFFKLCGRILVHGLILSNYLPTQFSQACMTCVFTGECSDKLAHRSLYKCMSETERDVVETAISEERSGFETFTFKIDKCIRIVLGRYGCKKIPEPYELNTSMSHIAKSFLIRQPYWALTQIREGLNQSELDCTGFTESDVNHLYRMLSPDVPSILERVTYITSDCELYDLEDRVKVMFEQYLHRLSKSELVKLLIQWSGYDCLCFPKLTVKFTDTDSKSMVFSNKEKLLCLPTSCTSLEELAQSYVSPAPISSGSDSRNAWEYTL